MSITVIIATYNRASLLEECLGQFARQSFETGDEVIVVDNGSTDLTAAVVDQAARRFPAPLRYVLEPKPGKSHALTAGISVAHGDIFALTDDDVLVADDWLSVVRALWREADIGLAGGRVVPRWSRRAPRWLRLDATGYGRLAAPLALLDYGPGRIELGSRTVLGANMAVHRAALAAAGGFPTDLGKLRGTLLMGEDHQLCARVQAAGFAAVYDPRLVVAHYVPADRLRLGYHLRWFFWEGISNAALDLGGRLRPAAGPRVRARHWLSRIAKGAVRTLAFAASSRTNRSVQAMADVAYATGYLAFSRNWVRTAAQSEHHTDRRVEAA